MFVNVLEKSGEVEDLNKAKTTGKKEKEIDDLFEKDLKKKNQMKR